MNIEDYRKQFDEESAPGWDAIDQRFAEFYPGVEPKHYGAVPHYALGGEDPIDGISIYRCETGDGEWHYHFVTYGFSNLYYDEDVVDDEFSGFGFEMTFRLKPFEEDDEDPTWVISLMQNLARYVFKSGNGFDDNHCLDARGPIRINTDTEIVGLAFVTDPIMDVIDTPHGAVKFIQLVGITADELQNIKDRKVEAEEVLNRIAANNKLLVTDLTRTSK